jgi:hypothetical protein
MACTGVDFGERLLVPGAVDNLCASAQDTSLCERGWNAEGQGRQQQGRGTQSDGHEHAESIRGRTHFQCRLSEEV